MNFKAFEDYIEQLCIHHVDVQHTVNGASCFARLLSEDEINKLGGNAGKIIVIIENVVGIPIGEQQSDLYRQSWKLSFLGIANQVEGTPSANIDNILQKTWEVMMDFRAKMINDFYNDDCGPLKGLNFKMNYRVVEDMQLINHFGWELDINQNISAPQYNALKWN